MNSISLQKPIKRLFPLYNADCPLTSVTGNVAVQPRENQITVFEVLGFAVTDNKVAEIIGHGPGLLPFHSIFVRLARRTLRGTDSVELQQWVLSKEEDESLADRASGSKNTFFSLARTISCQ